MTISWYNYFRGLTLHRRRYWGSGIAIVILSLFSLICPVSGQLRLELAQGQQMDLMLETGDNFSLKRVKLEGKIFSQAEVDRLAADYLGK